MLASCVIDPSAGPEYNQTVHWIASDTKIYKKYFPAKEYEYALDDGLGAAQAYQNIDVTQYDVFNWIKTHYDDVSDKAAFVAGHFLQREIQNSKMGNLTAEASYEALSDGVKEGLSGLTHEQYQQSSALRLAEGKYWLKHHETWQQQQADLSDPGFPARAMNDR